MYNKKSIFEESEKSRYKQNLLSSKYLNHDKGFGPYIYNMGKPDQKTLNLPFILINGFNNLYPAIREDAIKYYDYNSIKWWSLEGCNEDGTNPPTHVLSSQVCCINHLFPTRQDYDAVLDIAKAIDPDFTEVCLLENDKQDTCGYISFEVVGKKNHLNEKSNNRGEFCTSIDALILGIRNDKRTMIVIEWKYTESYEEKDLSKEDCPGETIDSLGKGYIRLRRYSDLIRKSSQIDHYEGKELRGSLYFFEPFYQLMRQTLWAEQMVLHNSTEHFQAEDYIHVHVVPADNKDLLDTSYPQPGGTMEDTWRSVLKDQSKYKIIDPKSLFSLIDKKYESLVDYLANRYWNRIQQHRSNQPFTYMNIL